MGLVPSWKHGWELGAGSSTLSLLTGVSFKHGHTPWNVRWEEQVSSTTYSTLFYFTDNLVTYYIVAGGSFSSVLLQKLLWWLKYLELMLFLCLKVVHVPGLHTISQGTDGLSWGLHLLPANLPQHPKDETLRIFEGLLATQRNINWGLHIICPHQHHSKARYVSSTSTWDFPTISQCTTM